MHVLTVPRKCFVDKNNKVQLFLRDRVSFIIYLTSEHLGLCICFNSI